MAGFKNIVVCSDFSENADRAFNLAAGLAAEGAQLTVLHVVPATFNYEQMKIALGTASPLGSLDNVKAKLRERYAAKAQVPVEVAVEYGSEAATIDAFAKDKGADVIVVGARGVGFVAGLFGGGSVVNKVVKSASVPVLVVPA